MTHLQAIIVMLRGWLDYMPWPETATGGIARRSTLPGQVPSRTIICPTCQGQGKLAGGWPCRECRGAGHYAIDTTTLLPVLTDEASMRDLLDTTVPCDRCGGYGRLGAHAESRPDKRARLCERCEGTGQVPALLVALESARVSRRRAGDHELDALMVGAERREGTEAGKAVEAGMRTLRELDPVGHGLICCVLVLGMQEPESLPPVLRHRLVRALLLLERVVPKPLRLPSDLAQAEREQRRAVMRTRGRHASIAALSRRDAEIISLYATGSWTQAALGQKYGLGQQAISKVLARSRSEAA